MVSKVKVDSPDVMSKSDLKEKLVAVFREVFDEAVESEDIDLSEFDGGDDIVSELTNNWSGGHEVLTGINKVIEALGFELTGEMVRDVTFTIT